jgi:ribosomal protein L11 methyltransferase
LPPVWAHDRAIWMENGLVIVVLATMEQHLLEATRRMSELGVPPSETLAPGGPRMLLLAPAVDEAEGALAVAHLRAEGRTAVLRPDGGPRLAAWARHTRPIEITGRLTVCFAWSEHDRRDLPGVVELDPGFGFGTGGHPSTRLLLDELARRLAGGERVLDVGCGSGVLALSALRLGAASALAVDVDARAIEASRANGELNGLGARLQPTVAPLGQIGGVFDVVVANIGWAAIEDLAPDLVERVSPGGWLAVSGISPAHCSRVAASLRPLEVGRQQTDGDWAALVLARPPSRP